MFVKTRSTLKVLFSKALWINLFLAALLSLGLLLLLNFSLKIYTRHGQSVTVPDITNKPIDKAIEILSDNGLEYEILDSSYVDKKPPLTVLDMNPKPNAKVKSGRIIYLTINASTKPTIQMPDLVGKSSYKFAKLQLEGYGLSVAEPVLKPDPHGGAVLEVLINGKAVTPGTRIAKGTLVTLVVGDGLMNTSFNVPYLIGLTYQQAMDKLNAIGLPFGSVVVDDGITDTTNAFIYKQFPSAENHGIIRTGEAIDIFLSKEMPADIEIHEELYDKAVDTIP